MHSRVPFRFAAAALVAAVLLSISALGQTPVDPYARRRAALDKYQALYVGSDPARHATLLQARAVKAKLASEGFNVSNGIWGNEVRSGANLARMVPEAELVRDGFPEDFPFLATIMDTDGEHHSVEQLGRWLNSGLWSWGLKWCLRVVW